MVAINIIKMEHGIINFVNTFISDVSEGSERRKNTAVQQAEEQFEAEIRKLDGNVTDDDIFVALDNGSWDDLNGNQIIINWSKIQNI
jgi:hypothetical protein